MFAGEKDKKVTKAKLVSADYELEEYYHPDDSKSEDNYILKYDAIYKLSKNEVDIIEQNNLIQYGRFINKNYALVCYVLYKNNHLLSECEFSPAHFQLYDTNIIYTDFLQGPELIMD
jgi:hypothetical protein